MFSLFQAQSEFKDKLISVTIQDGCLGFHRTGRQKRIFYTNALVLVLILTGGGKSGSRETVRKRKQTFRYKTDLDPKQVMLLYYTVHMKSWSS